MFTKAIVALSFALATTSGALAATKQPSNDMYERGIYVGTDPDANVRFELHRDADRGNSN